MLRLMEAKTKTKDGEVTFRFRTWDTVEEWTEQIGEESVVAQLNQAQKAGATAAARRGGDSETYLLGQRQSGTGQKSKALFAERVAQAASEGRALSQDDLRSLAAEVGFAFDIVAGQSDNGDEAESEDEPTSEGA